VVDAGRVRHNISRGVSLCSIAALPASPVFILARWPWPASRGRSRPGRPRSGPGPGVFSFGPNAETSSCYVARSGTSISACRGTIDRGCRSCVYLYQWTAKQLLPPLGTARGESGRRSLNGRQDRRLPRQPAAALACVVAVHAG